MAGLGTALNPNGESGTVDSPVINQTDVVQTNKGDIKQTTSIETVSHVIYKDWIYSRTYNIDSSMKPGHIFGYIRIHPKDCNPYVNYISQMFKTWTGGMKVRARFMANFANGGSFRIGYLPPIFTKNDIMKVPLSTLTAYPNQDLDPKNTDWTEFRTSDQRNIAYHYMQDPDAIEDVMNFGGWIVFYVVGSLVQSLQTSGSVQMVIETAGDFEFRQLAPLDVSSSANSGPLPPYLLGNIAATPGCDNCFVDDMRLMASPVKTANPSCGGVAVRRLDGAWLDAPKLSPYAAYYRSAPSIVSVVEKFNYQTYEDYKTGVFKRRVGNKLPLGCVRYAIAAAASTNASPDDKTPRYEFKEFDTKDPKYYTIKCTLELAEEQRWRTLKTGEGYPAMPDGTTEGTPYESPYHGECEFENLFPGESLVYWNCRLFKTVDLQPRNISAYLTSDSLPPSNTSYLFSLRDQRSPTNPIMWIRLASNGLFTTNAVSGSVSYYGSRYFFHYEQELSPTSPLPPVPNAFALFENMTETRRAYKLGLLSAQNTDNDPAVRRV